MFAFCDAPVVVTGITDATYLYHELKQLEQWIQEANYMVSSLEYQIMVLQQLDQGTWTGFVNAFNDETASLDTFNTAIQALPQLTNASSDSGLYTFAQQTSNLTSEMDAANNVVNQTNVLVQQTPVVAQLIQGGFNNVRGASGPLQALQGTAQILGGMGQEIRTLEMTDYATLTFFTTVLQVDQKNERAAEAGWDDFTPADADPADPASTSPFYVDASSKLEMQQHISGNSITTFDGE